MKIDQVLTNLGLTDMEPDIYLTLLKTPGAQPASIIAARSNSNRTTTYKTLIRLVKKGLATKTQRHGITCFFAEDPENRLKLMIDEKQKQLGEMSQAMLEALPLLNIGDDGGALPKIRYYEGIEGIKQIYEAVLKEGKNIYRYGDIAKIYEALGIYTDEYIKKRNEIGIVTYAIMPFHEEERKTLTAKHTQEHRHVLYIPHKFFPIEGEVRIFGNKVAVISLRKESPIGVIIESETIAKMFHAIFMLTWKNHRSQIIRTKK